MLDIGRYKLDKFEKGQTTVLSPAKVSYGIKITKKKLFEEWKALNNTEKVVYIALKLFASREGICWPSTRYLSKGLALSKTTIVENIHALKEKGYLEIKKKWGKKRGVKNIYTLLR